MAQRNPGLMIALGIGKKPAPDSGPSPYKMGGGDPGPDDSGGGGEPDADDQGSPTIGPEDVDYSDNDLCETCAHLQGETCGKYSFPVDKTGHCAAGYEPRTMTPDNSGGAPMPEMGPGQ